MTESTPTPDSTDAPATESAEQSPANEGTTPETAVTGIFIAQN